MTRTYSLQELCDLANVTERTVRYYIRQGLLPSPGVGRGTRYGADHLARLRLIRRLQEAFLPLSEIRSRLDRMSGDQIQAEQADSDLPAPAQGQAGPSKPLPSRVAPAPAAESAADYVARLLARSAPHSVSIPEASDGHPPLGAPPPSLPLPSFQRSTWERIILSSDLEIHVRRPLSRSGNRKVDQIVSFARNLLSEEEK